MPYELKLILKTDFNEHIIADKNVIKNILSSCVKSFFLHIDIQNKINKHIENTPIQLKINALLIINSLYKKYRTIIGIMLSIANKKILYLSVRVFL